MTGGYFRRTTHEHIRHRQHHPTAAEAKGLTQAELAGMLSVSAKTISKWETAKGLPDISLLEPLAAALGSACWS